MSRMMPPNRTAIQLDEETSRELKHLDDLGSDWGKVVSFLKLTPFEVLSFIRLTGTSIHNRDAQNLLKAAIEYEEVTSEPLRLQATEESELTGLKVSDLAEFGRKIVDWATEPGTRPNNAEELREQLGGIAVVSKDIKEVFFSQPTADTVTINLPTKEDVESRAASAGVETVQDKAASEGRTKIEVASQIGYLLSLARWVLK